MILKKDQIELLNEISKITNKKFMIEKKNELCEKCLQLNETKKQSFYDFSRLNIEYIQGLFDAEGHFDLNYRKENNEIRFTKGVYMKITQLNHPEILVEIQKFLNFGKIDGNCFKVQNFKDCIKLNNLIQPNLIVKYNQSIAFQKYFCIFHPYRYDGLS